MSKKLMQAVLVNEYGGPNVLKGAIVERPQPQANEVLVRIVYAAVIPLDYKIRNGWLQKCFPYNVALHPRFLRFGSFSTIMITLGRNLGTHSTFSQIKRIQQPFRSLIGKVPRFAHPLRTLIAKEIGCEPYAISLPLKGNPMLEMSEQVQTKAGERPKP
ncbi:hypothetical protein L8C07_09080 [Paenibacillus sp. CMAA1739]|nr:hypothetical protein [Paenibacillus ottowii]MDP1510679.1 hypothetical protein [Paenibacillus ottowii]MEC4566097.1 hypothetical protein [Paenibacillus sp. CMAA1739]